MFQLDWIEHVVWGAIAAVLLACLGVVAWMIYVEVRHPCKHNGPEVQCGGYRPVGDALVPYTYDCTPCVEREP